jgi:hypothetical protein
VRVALEPLHIAADAGVIEARGSGFTVTVLETVPVHVFASVTVTV